MGVEIGTLILRGQFGAAPGDARDDPRARTDEMEALRRRLLREVADMLDEAKPHHWER